MSRIALVIGSDSVISDFASLILRRAHIEVLQASNGYHGIKMTLAHLPDVVLSAHHIPYCTGLDVLKTIRAHGRTRHIPFISIFTELSTLLQHQHIANGANAALTPPLGSTNLLKTVCDALKKTEEDLAFNMAI